MARGKKVKLPVDKLVVGLMVDVELPWSKHPFFFSKFKIKDVEEIAIIKSLKLEEVTVFPEQSEVIPQDAKAPPISPTPDETEAAKDTQWQTKKDKMESAERYRVKRLKIDRQYREQSNMVQRIAKDLRTSPANAINDAYELVESLADQFQSHDEVLTNLVNLGNGQHTLYNHSVNVMVLSMILGRAMGVKDLDFKILARGALLHDIGKVMVPGQIANKTTKLTRAELGVYQQHTINGRKLCDSVEGSREELLQIMEMHHEYLDGTGYPKQLKDKQIPLLPRIVTVANTYDNLCNPPNIKLAMTPKTALASMYAKLKDKLDNKLVQKFVSMLGIFPAGSIVSLNDESLGVVVSVDPKHMMEPEVLVYNPDIPANKAMILNLQEHKDLKIVRTLKPSQCPQRVYTYLGIKDRLGYMASGRSV